VSGITASHCRDPRVLLATGCGSGFAPSAPGTAGSLVALTIWWFGTSALPLGLELGALVIATVLGVWAVAATCRIAGVGDDPRIVFDEWLGMWVALLGCPRQLAPVAYAFLLFRLFDILKPWPVSWAERRRGAIGVVLDDLVAGGLAAAVLQLSIALFHTIHG
jgi:phosphatidylglycerophosphatase A